MKGIIFVEGQVLLFVAGAALDESLNERLSSNIVFYEAGCGLRFHHRIIFGSWPDHSRIVPALAITFQLFSKIFYKYFKMEFCLAGAIFGEIGW